MTTAVLTREEAKQNPQEKKPRSRLPLGTEELEKLDAYWRAANYLSVGQIYLYDNPLLKEPLTKEHIKPRLLGHWGPRRVSISSMLT
jgi:phosphoketolase